jgi:predicted nucleic acid-binding protein
VSQAIPRVVIDASALLDYVLQYRNHKRIEAVLNTGVQLHAPELVDAEALSALRRWELSGSLGSQRADRALEFIQNAPISRYPLQMHNPRVWALRYGIRTSDAYYVSLAESLPAPLLTTDDRLGRAVASMGSIALVDLSGQ